MDSKFHPYIISSYHFIIFIGAGSLIVLSYFDCLDFSFICTYFGSSDPINEIATVKKVVYSLCFGAIGGTLNASRVVVHAVRRDKYETKRILWQILTPIHSSILAVCFIVLLKAGLISLTNGNEPVEPTYTWFVMGFSFIVGFSSELVIKRLINMAEALFAEEKRDQASSAKKSV